MFAFCVCIGDQQKFNALALPGILGASEPDSWLLTNTAQTSIFACYNEMLDRLAAEDAIEGAILLHEDCELRQPDVLNVLRTAYTQPDVAVVGVIGARQVRSLSWWDYETYGYCAETRGVFDFGRGTHDVEIVDGLFLALSPWAVRNLRFDDSRFTGFHGYDVDVCFEARHLGKRVLVTDISLFHHAKGAGITDPESFLRSNNAFVEKWISGSAVS